MAQTKGRAMDIHHIPTDQILDTALLRDRSHLPEDALQDLVFSISRDGLRQPIELFELAEPPGGFDDIHRYGLISGLRRLTAIRRLASWRANGDFTTIPAFLRTPATIPEAMAQMIAENEIRENLSPWERGLTIVTAVNRGLFDSMDQAIVALHPTALKQKRNRLRNLALVAEELQGMFSTPETLTQSQMERLGAALRGGLTDLIHQILTENAGKSLQSQWTALIPTLTEALSPETEATATAPGRPRRLLQLQQGLTIRREKSPHGWALIFSGPEARKGALMDDVMDYIERWFQPRA
jgi:ParB family chromosome partitioning protein